ncbi:hypothetical protein EOPP23_05570 [Endozoicomonas sp. OPT23]|uniref:S1 family peptidase n=1 Tax=Endozoicomonas sp. OPT23 TaxID=2072845 RepID=UPI00129A2EAE|nr:trypsin-like serine protease [Endozoicomonas sp. OPT23]MRI32453.1 hypothetical protein [Endozoicomonas sp. OPT23]
MNISTKITAPFLSLILGSFLLSIFSLASSSDDIRRFKRVVHGESVSETDLPWMVALTKPHAKHAVSCSGALIANRWLLTARHCVVRESNGIPFAPSEIHFSLQQLDGNQLPFRRVRSIHILPGYSNNSVIDEQSDIALVETEDPFENIPKLQLNLNRISDDEIELLNSESGQQSRQVFIAGWGYREDGIDPMMLKWGAPTLLTRLDLNQFPQQSQKQLTDNDFRFTLMTGNPTQPTVDGCAGDSGSPIWLAESLLDSHPEAIGISINSISSHNHIYKPADRCGRSGDIALYLRLSEFKDFIYSTKGFTDKIPFKWEQAEVLTIPEGAWRATGEYSTENFLCRIGTRAGRYDPDTRSCIYLNDSSEASASDHYQLLTGNPYSVFEWRGNLQGHSVNELTTCYQVRDSSIIHSHEDECEAYCLAHGEVGIIHNSLCIIAKLDGKTRSYNQYERLVDRAEPFNLNSRAKRHPVHRSHRRPFGW